ncbi:hypothetical protein QMP26_24265 [Enterocloster clostridioformis]
MENETLIANHLTANYPILQIKNMMYFPNDIYYKIPVLVFRFDKLINMNIYKELRLCIEAYNGNLNWTLFESFYGKKVRNYIICPYEVYIMQKTCFEKNITMSSQDYFTKEEYENLCEKAIEDIPLLYEHIKNNFCPDGEKYFNAGEQINQV